MGIEQIQVLAGLVSSSIFVVGTLPMLFKAFTTHNMQSYSLGNLALSNFGNLIHWVYVMSLPFGPVWLLHGFFTFTTGLMLVWYLRYEMGCALTPVPHCMNQSARCFARAGT